MAVQVKHPAVLQSFGKLCQVKCSMIVYESCQPSSQAHDNLCHACDQAHDIACSTLHMTFVDLEVALGLQLH